MQQPDSQQTAALQAVLEPFASLILKQGIGAKPVLELFKIAFVAAATQQHGKDGKSASISGVARATGLTRKEVRRIRDVQIEIASRTEIYSPSESDILHHWYSTEKFMGKDGQPRALELGPGPGTFTELVSEAIDEDSALKFLSRLSSANAVTVSDDGEISMNRRDFLIGPDFPKLLSMSLAPLAVTLDKNWGLDPRLGFCQRLAHSSMIDPGKVDTIRRVARDRISNFLEEIDDFMMGVESPEEKPFYGRDGKELKRLGVGAFYFEIEK